MGPGLLCSVEDTDFCVRGVIRRTFVSVVFGSWNFVFSRRPELLCPWGNQTDFCVRGVKADFGVCGWCGGCVAL